MWSRDYFLSSLALATAVLCAPVQDAGQRTPTVWLAGDSTMAVDGGPIEGWGPFLPYSLTVPVINRAVAGTSARSYTVQGLFASIINAVKPNDIVVIEFGHNDGGSLSTDNGRTDCPGSGDQICHSVYNGQNVTVHTFPWYLIEAGKALIAKGAKVIISSQTPDNPWETGTFVYTDGGRFVGYAKEVAEALGTKSAMYVDHGAYTANIWKLLGAKVTDADFPGQHTHTSPAGAAIVAQAFVKGVQCGGGGFLKGFVKNATASIPGVCL